MIAESIQVPFNAFMSADTPMLHTVDMYFSPYGDAGSQRKTKYMFWYKTAS